MSIKNICLSLIAEEYTVSKYELNEMIMFVQDLQ
jgi:hypothetical protein